MKHATTLVTALSGLALISGLQSTAKANPETKHAQGMNQHETLEDLLPNLKKPELWIGSSAPELSIAKFLNGDSVHGFEKGQVYVVEFWATWCGPCITAFPHLTQMQESYGDDVRFIGVNVWEQEKGQERIDMVEQFVADQGERMGYTVAIEDGTSMADNWMKPAGQGGIPAAFIVDGNSKIAWIGHPGQMDEPLKAVASGDFDSEEAAKEAWEENLLSTAFQTLSGLLQSGKDIEKARKISTILINDHFSDNPRGLNAVAWMFLNSEADDIGMPDYQTALRAIAKAADATEWKDWGILDTYALAMFKTGDTASAVKWQKKAIELAKLDTEHGGNKAVAELEESLTKYEN